MKIKSVTDVITNSSSEVFVLNTEKSLEEVKKELAEFTSGYLPPIIFNLEECRKGDWEENSNEEKKLRHKYYESLDGRFFDSGTAKGRIEFTLYYFTLHSYELLEAHKRWKYWAKKISEELKSTNEFKFARKTSDEYLLKKINSLPKVSSVISITKNFYQYNRSQELKDCIEKIFEKVGYPLPVSKELDMVNLNGKIILLSEDDNSIPYADFEEIKKRYNAFSQHLG